MADLIERAKAALEGATPGPWELQWHTVYADREDVEYWTKKVKPKDRKIGLGVGTVLTKGVVGISVFQADHCHWRGHYISGDTSDFILAALAPELARALIDTAAEREAAIAELVQGLRVLAGCVDAGCVASEMEMASAMDTALALITKYEDKTNG